MAWEKTFDYIVIGGGLSGCVVAARLHEAHPSLSIAVLEAGPDESRNPSVLSPVLAPTLHGTPLVYSYETAPQPQLGGRKVENWGGRLLSGSSAVNYGAWTRGHAVDFDKWAKQVGDPMWSYKGLLPYFKKSEHWHDKDATGQHGFSGPIHTSSGGRDYLLCEPLKKALLSTGLKFNPDMNGGDPNGVARLAESWHEASRQHAAICYNLKGIHVMTNTAVQRILFDNTEKEGKPKAIGVELADGQRRLAATKEVIVSCGGLRTPQVLMLSGVGPRSELTKHKIQPIVDLPVGHNLHDHPSINMVWRVKNPEGGYAYGSKAFNKPEYANGNPMDWLATAAAPDSELQHAASVDKNSSSFQPGPRSDYELVFMYGVTSTSPKNYPPPPMDGSHITTGAVCLSATSRGTVTLPASSKLATENPIIDPQYMTTEHDRAVMRAGMRHIFRTMESAHLRDLFVGPETPPEGLPVLTSASSDRELDERIKAMSWCWYHSAGTASMGSVVDTRCRVYGVSGLRVVDASIMPLALTAHLQAPLYGIAELAADLIAHDHLNQK